MARAGDGFQVNPTRIFHRMAFALWLIYLAAWASGYLVWWMVVAYTAVCTVAWAETGNERWEPDT